MRRLVIYKRGNLFKEAVYILRTPKIRCSLQPDTILYTAFLLSLGKGCRRRQRHGPSTGKAPLPPGMDEPRQLSMGFGSSYVRYTFGSEIEKLLHKPTALKPRIASNEGR